MPTSFSPLHRTFIFYIGFYEYTYLWDCPQSGKYFSWTVDLLLVVHSKRRIRGPGEAAGSRNCQFYQHDFPVDTGSCSETGQPLSEKEQITVRVSQLLTRGVNSATRRGDLATNALSVRQKKRGLRLYRIIMTRLLGFAFWGAPPPRRTMPRSYMWSPFANIYERLQSMILTTEGLGHPRGRDATERVERGAATKHCVWSVVCGVTYELPSELRKLVVTFRAGLPGSCVLPRRPLPPSRVPCLRPVFFNTTTDWPRVLRSVSQRGPGCLAANPRCWARLRSKRVASGPQFTAELTRSATEPGRPGTCRCAQLIGWTAPRERRARGPLYRCSPGMSLTCEQTGHTGALCVC